ncbi:hypothetical protein [Pseudomonas sp. SMV7]|uniref:hypothetical protein n=1 Tax=Pseudomonas sp. SMV7 TaxID=3390194 RepID=UPI003F860874
MTQSTVSQPNVCPRLFWRLVFAQMLVLGAFLYISLISLGVYLLMLGFDAEQAQPQQWLALAGGSFILLVSLWLLKVTMPWCIGPASIDSER